jgi:hypothetical protein
LFQSGGSDGMMNTVEAKWNAEDCKARCVFASADRERFLQADRSFPGTRARWRYPGDRRAGPRRGLRIWRQRSPEAWLFVVKRGSGIEALPKRIH